jgi:hypothetical protein
MKIKGLAIFGPRVMRRDPPELFLLRIFIFLSTIFCLRAFIIYRSATRAARAVFDLFFPNDTLWSMIIVIFRRTNSLEPMDITQNRVACPLWIWSLRIDAARMHPFDETPTKEKQHGF